ncbi:putative membrane protein [Mycobacterium xenopi 3993]|nr:putative membrane protein [Mycobacterium xenopi 3993]
MPLGSATTTWWAGVNGACAITTAVGTAPIAAAAAPLRPPI